MGAVMGYSEQHTLLLMTTDEEVEAFLNVSGGDCLMVERACSCGGGCAGISSVLARQNLLRAWLSCMLTLQRSCSFPAACHCADHAPHPSCTSCTHPALTYTYTPKQTRPHCCRRSAR